MIIMGNGNGLVEKTEEWILIDIDDGVMGVQLHYSVYLAYI